MLEINNIYKKFENNTVLKNLTFSVAPQEIAILLGGSGAGKSTAIRIVSKLENPDTGSITLNNQPIKQHDVGMVFQDFNLFPHWSIQDNIIKPLILAHNISEGEAQQRSNYYLSEYGLYEKREYYPHELSGGQKQRAALARTLATKPDIICLDEPTSALDPVLTKSIAHTVQSLAKQGFYILCATHDIDFVKQLSCTIHYMEAGKIVESRNSSDLNALSDSSKIGSFIRGNKI